MLQCGKLIPHADSRGPGITGVDWQTGNRAKARIKG